ncbi:Hypothetical protein, conserved [Brucella abortus str. 2308 A]|uniref:Uncharacterized protein n=3 Tax=Brucella TaxID=234 RepID=A9MAY8_BRUC2|nr:Hypothetical protein, conserved [Brucella canis ATCC 23365]ABY38074.1 Hypothetical protein, conserved [Brucella suis ATCC 23445]ADZ66060.1 conserved hypothetical protein [Brucella melitensis M28]ADZ86922.1 conserved hypothetical protein [Brucella melitensis M5-90]AEW13146.1 Transcriptional antiterminator [Brucella canis HSK A52141]AEW17873.1 Transcriptional antiterminator [Brucella abortus A13334]AIB17709.1 Hypothetical protein BSSP3_I0989 [Brucella suis bv. 2]EEH14500.1 Hypothetical prot
MRTSHWLLGFRYYLVRRRSNSVALMSRATLISGAVLHEGEYLP